MLTNMPGGNAMTPYPRQPNRRDLLARSCLAAGAAVVPAFWLQSASAQVPAWPRKPVRLIVPYAPGGFNDIVARIVADKLAPSLGQPVVVENRAGAGAIVGTEVVVKSPPDGHTLLMAASGPMVFNPVLVAKLPYSSQDLVPISMAGAVPLILAVNDAFPAKTLAELVTYSQANPDKTSYSYPAASMQLIVELIKSKSGLRALNVPYQGSAPSMNALLTQEVQMTLIEPGGAAALLAAGKVRALAVTSEQRLLAYPNVATLREQGIDVSVTIWNGLFAPAGTPAPIISRLQSEMARIMALPDVVEKLQKLEVRAVGGTSAELAKTVAQEIELWTQVARANNISAK
jgi:tripartite-type tricarboxylate transporter receptor subunit TctC